LHPLPPGYTTAGDGHCSASGDSDGWNAGVGAQYFLTEKDGVRAEYTKWDVSGDNVDANTWAVSYVRKF